jgi:hypothetical protein
VGSSHKLVILNETEGGVKDLLYLPFNVGAKRHSANAENFSLTSTRGRR